MATFNWIASWGASLTVKPSIQVTRYGEGYEQRAGQGMNVLPRKWSVTFSVVPDTAEEIEQFLTNLQGVGSFDWLPPTGQSGKFVCDDGWSRVIDTPGQHTISAVFREVFEP